MRLSARSQASWSDAETTLRESFHGSAESGIAESVGGGTSGDTDLDRNLPLGDVPLDRNLDEARNWPT
jgi:hypothetical protein